ncbi:MAG: hypothetical protein COX80_00415 [Candidatus Magasanikbacteria bacterium CG_4_10_14_0_2_um_filter_33_14]|uniref:Uncharacterized protein n=1 Tax=Candidatus Magasanikbacteria bacterium CG_4_10_14_0_2_um_filter_33_14 TaxID=1974636 RepID=A0A2M7VBZ8_9BACT|nr:MAG: hypothetical protein COX80_00415 [Candidatus Magasanikbacteria bacterium CG_4_10_14_0_2_um_filter_33_14]
MKFGIVLDSKQNKGMLSLNSLNFIKVLVVIIFFVIAQPYLLKIFDYRKFDFLFLSLLVFILIFFIRHSVFFEDDFIVLGDGLNMMRKKIYFNEIKELIIDDTKMFHIILDEGKEFVFRVRRNSEYEDLRNQFYSVGLYKGDIRK